MMVLSVALKRDMAFEYRMDFVEDLFVCMFHFCFDNHVFLLLFSRIFVFFPIVESFGLIRVCQRKDDAKTSIESTVSFCLANDRYKE